VDGGEHFVVFLHPYQVRDMRTSTQTGQWLDIQKAAASGGEKSKNAIFTGALGMYNNVIIHEWARLPLAIATAGTAVASTRRAVFAGAQAACVAFGQGDGRPNKMDWVEELFDFKNQLGVSAGAIAGLKKSIFNSKDFGTIAIPTYAAAS
jgi:N4-gp56 family major capsid protein